ncbi:MAG TPA: dihydroneopterin aldolase [Chthoniobacterales bacterium]
MVRNVILGWSGTLVDDLDAVVQATNAVLQAFGRTVLSRDDFRREFELPTACFYRRQLPDCALSDIEVIYHDHFSRSREAVPLLPHARAFLGFCRATGRRLFLISTIHARHFEAQSARLGVRGLFEAVYPATTDKTARVAEVLHEHRLVAAETACLGDMVHDIQAAKAAGVASVAVLTGIDAVEKLAAAGPDLIVQDLGVLQHILEAGSAGHHERIEISDLEVTTHIGASLAEQEMPQKLWLDLALEIGRPFAALEDALERTVDYAAVADAVTDFARTHRCRLIETFAAELAKLVTGRFPVLQVDVTVKKQILPNTRQVSVRTRHTRR